MPSLLNLCRSQLLKRHFSLSVRNGSGGRKSGCMTLVQCNPLPFALWLNLHSPHNGVRNTLSDCFQNPVDSDQWRQDSVLEAEQGSHGQNNGTTPWTLVPWPRPGLLLWNLGVMLLHMFWSLLSSEGERQAEQISLRRRSHSRNMLWSFPKHMELGSWITSVFGCALSN